MPSSRERQRGLSSMRVVIIGGQAASLQERKLQRDEIVLFDGRERRRQINRGSKERKGKYFLLTEELQESGIY